jgi:hypothetical protein
MAWLGACGKGAPTASQPDSSAGLDDANVRSDARQYGSACGRTTIAPATYDHVIVMVFENETTANIIGNSMMPFTTQIAHECGLANNYWDVGDPSLPNYIAMTSGSRWGIIGDSSPALSVDNIFHQVTTKWLADGKSGKAWGTYSSKMPSNCYLKDYPPAPNACYTAHHEPSIYYSNEHANCVNWDVPLGDTATGALASDLAHNTLPALVWIGPADDCGNHAGGEVDPPMSDAFLKTWLNVIVNSAAYQDGKTAVFITWDEGSNFSNKMPENIPMIVVAPSVPNGTVTSASLMPSFNHYSLLHTMEEMLGLSLLQNASTAPTMRTTFNL